MWNGNLPQRAFPVAKVDIFTDIAISEFPALAERYGGTTLQIDWGAWGLRLTGAAMRAVLQDRIREEQQRRDMPEHITKDQIYVLIIGEAG